MARVTKKSVIEKLNSSPKVIATLVGGKATEDWPEIVERVKQRHPDALVEETGIRLPDRRYILKPQVSRHRVGSFFASSGTYDFTWKGQSTGGRVANLEVSSDGQALVFKLTNGVKVSYAAI